MMTRIKMTLSKIIAILIVSSVFLYLMSCFRSPTRTQTKTPTRIENVLCKDSNLWYEFSLDSANKEFIPCINCCYTFYENNKCKNRFGSPCYVDFDGKGLPPKEYLEWYYYPFIDVLHIGKYNSFMKILSIHNDTIVFKNYEFYKDNSIDDIRVFINMGEEYSNYNYPSQFLAKDLLESFLISHGDSTNIGVDRK